MKTRAMLQRQVVIDNATTDTITLDQLLSIEARFGKQL